MTLGMANLGVLNTVPYNAKKVNKRKIYKIEATTRSDLDKLRNSIKESNDNGLSKVNCTRVLESESKYTLIIIK